MDFFCISWHPIKQWIETATQRVSLGNNKNLKITTNDFAKIPQHWQVEPSLDRQEHFSQFQDTPDALSCHIHLPVCLWIMDPHSRVPKKSTNHGNEVLPQDTPHLIQRPRYQRGSLCQDSAGTRTTRRPSDYHNERQTEVVWTCLPFIRSGQNRLARQSERGKKQGRQKKRWEDNIREWTGLALARSQRAVEKREKWRKLVVKSSVVPQWPLWLRDRWRWEYSILQYVDLLYFFRMCII